MTFREDGARQKYAGDVLILTRLLDGSRVVAAQSQRYILTGDLPRLQEFKSTRLPYLRIVRVSPGSYRLEAIVRDRLGNRTGTSEIAVEIPETKNRPVIAGDLLVIRSLKPVAAKRAQNHPLAWRRSVATPALEEPIAPGSERLLLAIPLVMTGGHVSARLALLFEDRELAEVPVHLGEPDKRGGLVGLIELSIADLPEAQYQLRLTLEAAGHEIRRVATVVLAPPERPCHSQTERDDAERK